MPKKTTSAYNVANLSSLFVTIICVSISIYPIWKHGALLSQSTKQQSVEAS